MTKPTTLDDNLGETRHELPTVETLLNTLVEKEQKKWQSKDDSEGTNEFFDNCLFCAKALVANNSESFTINDFYVYCEPFEISYEFKTAFFKKVVVMLVKQKRCVEILGVYDMSVFRIL